jgi:hypothetical protein
MPGKRAAGVTVRNVAMPDDLWTAAKEKALSDGLSLSEVVRRLLSDWLSA